MAMQVPEFLLRRLYVEGSLTNTADGFEFKLENSLGSGYAEGLVPLRIDGEDVALADASFVGEGAQAVSFASVTKEAPLTLEMGKALVVRVQGKHLAQGEHTIRMGFLVVGAGEMSFEVSDQVAGSAP